MQISPPFGYKEVVPFLKTQKVRLLAPGEVPDFVQHGNAIPISLSEFQPVAHDYPIVFTATEGTPSFAPVAVLGLTSGENLFFQGDNLASGGCIQAYARRYPFCMARVNLNQVEQKDRLISFEKKYITNQRHQIFHEKGQPNANSMDLQRLVGQYEADLDCSRSMCSILADY